MKEIEILTEVKSGKEKVLKALEHFEFKGAKEVMDIYFSDPLRENLQPDDKGKLQNSFRLRLKDGKASIAYKVDHFDTMFTWTHSDEYETGIENFDTALQINRHLGLKELIRIDNTKYTYLTDEYEIVLEDVKDLGLFLEVEKLSQVSDDKIADTKQEIRDFIKTLEIETGEELNMGKPELMLNKLNIKNILSDTFEK